MSRNSYVKKAVLSLCAASMIVTATPADAFAEPIRDTDNTVYFPSLSSISRFYPLALFEQLGSSQSASELVGSSNRKAGKITVNQGQRVDIDMTTCTVGYVDKNLRRAYIAGHCGNDGSGNVRDPKTGTHLGKIVHHQNYGGFSQNDLAYIQLAPGIVAGENTITKNIPVIGVDDVQEGDDVCFYGATTKATQCTKLTNRGNVEDGTFYGAPKLMRGGDSGGPAWIERLGEKIGFAGVNSGIRLSDLKEKIISATRFTWLNPFA